MTSIAAGTGISATPDPITTTGTLALDAALNDLNDVDTTGPPAAISSITAERDGSIIHWESEQRSRSVVIRFDLETSAAETI